MNSELQIEIQYIIGELQKKQEELADARNNDAMFEDQKRIFLEMKELNQRLQARIEKSYLSPAK